MLAYCRRGCYQRSQLLSQLLRRGVNGTSPTAKSRDQLSRALPLVSQGGFWGAAVGAFRFVDAILTSQGTPPQDRLGHQSHRANRISRFASRESSNQAIASNSILPSAPSSSSVLTYSTVPAAPPADLILYVSAPLFLRPDPSVRSRPPSGGPFSALVAGPRRGSLIRLPHLFFYRCIVSFFISRLGKNLAVWRGIATLFS